MFHNYVHMCKQLCFYHDIVIVLYVYCVFAIYFVTNILNVCLTMIL